MEFSAELRGNVTYAAETYFPGRDGYFVTSCFQHEESCRAYDYFGITVGTATPNSTFWEFYTRGGTAQSRVVDVMFPGDKTCDPFGFRHGSC